MRNYGWTPSIPDFKRTCRKRQNLVIRFVHKNAAASRHRLLSFVFILSSLNSSRQQRDKLKFEFIKKSSGEPELF